jgi:hypothetical protein
MSVQSDVLAEPHIIFDSATCLIVEFHKFAFIFVCPQRDASNLRTVDIDVINCDAQDRLRNPWNAEFSDYNQSCNHCARAERADDDISPTERGLFATVTGIQIVPRTNMILRTAHRIPIRPIRHSAMPPGFDGAGSVCDAFKVGGHAMMP